MKNDSQIRWFPVLVVAAVCGAVVIVVFPRMPPCKWTEPASKPQFEAEVQPMIDTIEQYRSAHGRYPSSLIEAGLSAESQYGPWRYDISQDGSGFGLGIGDYDACQWQISYMNGRGWYYDH